MKSKRHSAIAPQCRRRLIDDIGEDARMEVATNASTFVRSMLGVDSCLVYCCASANGIVAYSNRALAGYDACRNAYRRLLRISHAHDAPMLDDPSFFSKLRSQTEVVRAFYPFFAWEATEGPDRRLGKRELSPLEEILGLSEVHLTESGYSLVLSRQLEDNGWEFMTSSSDREMLREKYGTSYRGDRHAHFGDDAACVHEMTHGVAFPWFHWNCQNGLSEIEDEALASWIELSYLRIHRPDQVEPWLAVRKESRFEFSHHKAWRMVSDPCWQKFIECLVWRVRESHTTGSLVPARKYCPVCETALHLGSLECHACGETVPWAVPREDHVYESMTDNMDSDRLVE